VNKTVEKFEGKIIGIRGEQIDCELIINECVERGVISRADFVKHNIEPSLGLLFSMIVTQYNGKNSCIFKVRKTNDSKSHRRLTKVIKSLLEQL